MTIKTFTINLMDKANKIDFQKEVIEKSMHGPVLVDFYMEGCQPCKAIAPYLEKMVQDGVFDLVKLDTMHERTQALNHNIQKVPTLIIYDRGKIYRDSRDSGMIFNTRDLLLWAKNHCEEVSKTHGLFNSLVLWFKNLFTK